MRPKTREIAFLVLLAVIAGCNDAGDNNYGKVRGNVFENKLLGFSISKPDSWQIITAREGRKKISPAKNRDEKIADLVTTLDSRPIVSMLKSRTKLPPPALKVTLSYDEQSPDISTIEILNGCSRVGSNTFENYSVVRPPEEIEIDGRTGGYMKAHYTAQFRGDTKVYPVSYETWIIPRRRFFIMVSVMSSQMEDVKTQVEITSIIKSIKLN